MQLDAMQPVLDRRSVSSSLFDWQQQSQFPYAAMAASEPSTSAALVAVAIVCLTVGYWVGVGRSLVSYGERTQLSQRSQHRRSQGDGEQDGSEIDGSELEWEKELAAMVAMTGPPPARNAETV